MKWYYKLWYVITFRKHKIKNIDCDNIPGELVAINEWW